ATVAMFLAEGANVATCARDERRLRAALDGLPRTTGTQVYSRRCDVLDEGESRDFVEAAAEMFGGLDGVVNNAGRSLLASWSETTHQQWREELDLKLFSVLNTIRAALPMLRRSETAAV